jgi:molecular chaperone GrpE
MSEAETGQQGQDAPLPDELSQLRAELDTAQEQAHRYALEKFVQELLPAVDGLEMAVATSAKADAASLAAGQEATLKLLLKALDRFAVLTLDPQGEPFDPARHEAMVMQESTTAEPHSVLQVVQRGYELNGRLLRPARVIVARAPDNT